MSSKQEPVTDPFEVKVVPKNWKTQQDLTDDAARYRKIRLLALQTNPEAFGSNLERELAFTPQIWQERLQNEDANLIVVERHPPQVEDGQEDDDVGWLGMVVVFKQKKVSTS